MNPLVIFFLGMCVTPALVGGYYAYQVTQDILHDFFLSPLKPGCGLKCRPCEKDYRATVDGGFKSTRAYLLWAARFHYMTPAHRSHKRAWKKQNPDKGAFIPMLPDREVITFNPAFFANRETSATANSHGEER